MKPKTIIKTGKFKFLQFPNQGIRKNENIRKLATTGKLSYTKLEKFIEAERRLGFPIKYSKPIGFKKDQK
jgi:hypothetical protein